MYTGSWEQGPPLEATAGSLGGVCKTKKGPEPLLNQHLLVHTIILHAQASQRGLSILGHSYLRDTTPEVVANHHLRGEEGEAGATGAERYPGCPETSWGEHQPGLLQPALLLPVATTTPSSPQLLHTDAAAPAALPDQL